jgi:hypothetical protein
LAKPALISLIKPIEATKLNPRNGMSLGLPDVTVPYGALIEYVGPDRDRERFRYLSELYGCKREAFLSATGGKGLGKTEEEEEAAAPPAPQPAVGKAVMEKKVGEPAVGKAATEKKVEGPAASREVLLEWEGLRSSAHKVLRTPVPGGWLVALNGSGVAFVPDAKHEWDGGSVE